MSDANNRNRQAQQRQTRARLTQAESRLNELRAQRPAAPRTPSVPDADGSGYASKTNDPACKAAASAWQKAVKNGQVAPPEVYAQLARCREAARGGGGNQWAYHQQGRDYRASNQFVGPQSSRVEMQRRNQPAPATAPATAQTQRQPKPKPMNDKPPVIQGPNLPSIGRDAWAEQQTRRGRDVSNGQIFVDRTAAPNERQRAAAALRYLRSMGSEGRAEAQRYRNAATPRLPDSRSRLVVPETTAANIREAIRIDRIQRGENYNNRAGFVRDQIASGRIVTPDERMAYRNASAAELNDLRRTRNASFLASGQRAVRRHWRDTTNMIQAGQWTLRRQTVETNVPTGFAVTSQGTRREAARTEIANIQRDIQQRNSSTRSTQLTTTQRQGAAQARRAAQAQQNTADALAQRANQATPPPPPAATSRNSGTASGTAASRRRATNRMSPANSTTGSGAPSPTAAQATPVRNFPVPEPADRSNWAPPPARDGMVAVPVASGQAFYYHKIPPIAAADVMRDTPNPQSQLPSTSRVPRTVGQSAYTPEQLAQAQRQAGPAPDYASRSQHNLQQRADHVHHAENALGLKLMGSTTDEKFNHLVALSGYSPAYADQIEVRNSGDGYASIKITGPGGYRTIHLDRRNRPHIHNDVHFPVDNHRANGQALDQYSRSIVAARAAGVDAISVSGAGYGNGTLEHLKHASTGYFTWPSWGFDGSIDSAGGNSPEAIRQAHPDLANVRTYSQAFFHPNPEAATAALRAHIAHHSGGNPNVTLPLQDTSGVLRNFVSHYERVLGRSGKRFAKHTLRTVVTKNGGFES